MAHVISDAFKIAAGSGGKPIFLVEIDVGPAAYLRILDYSSAAAESFRLYYDDGASYVDVLGADWAPGSSNDECAANLAEYWNSGFELGAIASSAGSTVIFTSLTDDVLRITSSDDTVWDANPTRLPKTVAFCTGDKPYTGWTDDPMVPCSILSVSGVGSGLDFNTREQSIGDAEIVFTDDGVLREILSRTYHIFGAQVRVKLGFQNIYSTDFLTLGSYLIDEDPSISYGTITLNCADARKTLRDRMFAGAIYNAHPVDAIRRIFDVIGMDRYDSLTFNSSHAAHEDSRHWGVSAFIEEPTSAKSLIDELMLMLGGSIYYDAAQDLFVYRGFDVDAVSSKHMTESEISDMDVYASNSSTYNRVTFVDKGDDKNEPRTLYSAEDAIARSRDKINELKVESRWIGSKYGNGGAPKLGNWFQSWVTDYVSVEYSADATELVIANAMRAGFAGTRQTVAASNQHLVLSWTPDADGALDSTHLATILLMGVGRHEYVECDFAEPEPDESGLAYTLLPHVGWSDPQNQYSFTSETATVMPVRTRFSISSRGARGTTADSWITRGDRSAGEGRYAETIVYDVTIPVAVADRILSRVQGMMPAVRFRTHLINASVQVGDVISFDHSMPIMFRYNGVDSTVKWEVTNVEVDIGDSTGVTIEAVFLNYSHPRPLRAGTSPSGGFWPPPILPQPPDEVIDSNNEFVVDSYGNRVTT